MNTVKLNEALDIAVTAAHGAGDRMRRNLLKPKIVTGAFLHDIKLELDVQCQKLIEKALRSKFPKIELLGEEGMGGGRPGRYRWVVDPIDGTVNFTHGIPHACVSIALQESSDAGTWRSVVGVVLDPFCNELWTATDGGAALLNGSKIRVSNRRLLRDTVISIGFGKEPKVIRSTLAGLNWLLPRVRKVRITGADALGLSYVASGRFDAYVESGLRIWDVAAGGLIIERAGGEFWSRPRKGFESYDILASNGLLRHKLRGIMSSSC